MSKNNKKKNKDIESSSEESDDDDDDDDADLEEFSSESDYEDKVTIRMENIIEESYPFLDEKAYNILMDIMMCSSKANRTTGVKRMREETMNGEQHTGCLQKKPVKDVVMKKLHQVIKYGDLAAYFCGYGEFKQIYDVCLPFWIKLQNPVQL
jgi:hypothetical protein